MPELRPSAVAMTCPRTRGAARVTPGTAAIAVAMASASDRVRTTWPYSLVWGAA